MRTIGNPTGLLGPGQVVGQPGTSNPNVSNTRVAQLDGLGDSSDDDEDEDDYRDNDDDQDDDDNEMNDEENDGGIEDEVRHCDEYFDQMHIDEFAVFLGTSQL